jgi:hypothetical protein
MPREDAHQAKAEHNEQFAAFLGVADPVHESWATIAVFYSALHYVESYFSRVNVTCHKHEERDEKIKDDPGIRQAYSDYKFLFTLSITARYKLVGLPANAYSQASSHLAKVKAQINHAIAAIAARTSSTPMTGTPRTRSTLAPEPARPMPGTPKR